MAFAPPAPRQVRLSETARQEALEPHDKLPLSFVPNFGQTDSRVAYSAQGPGFSFSFTAGETVLSFARRGSGTGSASFAPIPRRGDEGSGVTIGLRFVGANPDVRPEVRRPGAGVVNYLIGNDPSDWQIRLSTYREIHSAGELPGAAGTRTLPAGEGHPGGSLRQ